jgi:hypothetical protein
MPKNLVEPEAIGRIAVEWRDDRPIPIPITHFDFDSLDPIEDQVRQHLADGTLRDFLSGWIERELTSDRAETINRMLSIPITSKKPGLAVIQMGFAAGILLAAEKTGTQWAKEFGITKEAFQEGVDCYRRELRLRVTRYTRDDSARQNMREKNFRHPRIK